ncbi:rhythmically expressed gene 5 protein [Planococcus citri]|uniref:rhythmically expressed gene 5 protein n=1 Tax=Planococcus citri TaxID=170843 RepID=UPI0031F85EAD
MFCTGVFKSATATLTSLCVAIVFVSAAISQASGSAIPMWEFLSRTEKMSHLFNTFSVQVAEYCKSSTMPDCNKVLLVYGLTNLAKMDDVALDEMDPYQRRANDKIWESMMKDSNRVTSQSQSQTKQQNHERDYYADALEPGTADENYLGSASDNVEENITVDGAGENDRYLSGPMMVRVRPDGSPVPDDDAHHQQTHLPKDEDMEEHVAMRGNPVPSVSELQEFLSPTPSPSPSPSPLPSYWYWSVNDRQSATADTAHSRSSFYGRDSPKFRRFAAIPTAYV